MSCALVLQLLLAALAFGNLTAAGAAGFDPAAICYGSSDSDPDHPDRKPANPVHCVLACVQAYANLAGPVPPSSAILPVPQATAASEQQAVAPIFPAKPCVAHSSRGPPRSA
jgi:hypothetical protein